LVGDQLQQIGVVPQVIVLEPAPRNTAPAACVVALLLAESDPKSLLMLAPSDHFIQDEAGLIAAVERAAQAAAEGWIVTFGARPDRPETGYGYIQQGESLARCDGCFRISRFVEKPDLATATGYLNSGQYVWNSGMFLLSAARLIEEVTRYEPAIVSACEKALRQATKDDDFLRLQSTAFADQPSIAFDRAVMERSDRGAVVPIDIGWSDIGSWDALHQVSRKDENGNVLSGAVISVDSRNSYLHSEALPIAALGLDGITVVSTADALLVCPRNRSQDLTLMVDSLAGDPRYASLVRRDTGEEDS
jgi:mannose-1-phosphate guanylyltransferase/mannose-6-phosphate isomerase